MAQNSFFVDKIDCEAMKVQADSHLQKSLPGTGITLKTIQAFLGIIFSYFKAYLREFIYPVSKISKLFVHFVMLLLVPAPFDLIITHYLKKQGYFKDK